MEDKIKELIANELPRLLSENLSVQVETFDEPYEREYKNIKVTIEYDGIEISSYYDSIHVPECKCNGG